MRIEIKKYKFVCDDCGYEFICSLEDNTLETSMAPGWKRYEKAGYSKDRCDECAPKFDKKMKANK